MIKATIKESVLKKSAAKSLSAFFEAVADRVEAAIKGNLTAESMRLMNADQITLIAYKILREEVLEGGFVQLIHNGYGAFIFVNPFARAVKEWGLSDLAGILARAHKCYSKHHARLEADMSDEEFMALYEKFPDFDALDEAFIDNEEKFTQQIACYVDDHLSNFCQVIK